MIIDLRWWRPAVWPRHTATMQTDITFLDGESSTFDPPALVRMTEHGVEVTQIGGEEPMRVLFPWSRIERVTQRGAELASMYTY